MKKVDINILIQLLGMLSVLAGLLFVGLEMRQSQRIALSEQQQQLIYLLQELNQRFLDLDRQMLEMQKSPEFLAMTSQTEEEYLANLQIIFAEELYQELCKVLGSDKIPFMGIA